MGKRSTESYVRVRAVTLYQYESQFVKNLKTPTGFSMLRIRDRKRIELSNNSIRFSRIESNRILNLKK